MTTMTTTMTKMTQWSMLVLASCVLACELPADLLEVGDGTDETGETASTGDGTGDGDGDGSGNGEGALECVVQGTNFSGGDEPLDFPLPECEVECATGWGHGAPLLANSWTVDLEHTGENTGFTFLDVTPTGELLALIGRYQGPARLVWISPEGALLDERTQPAIDGEVWSVALDEEGTTYALWRDDDMQSVTALSSEGELLWTVELGPHLIYSSVLAAMSSGVVVALNPADDADASQLLRVSAQGTVVSMGAIPITQTIAVSPSGDTIAVANTTTISWSDFATFPSWSEAQGVADADFVFGMVALDDEQIASVGVSKNWDEGGLGHGYVKRIGQMGLEWEGQYDRAVSWCPEHSEGEATATSESFFAIERLADGSLLIVGAENGGYGNGSNLGQMDAEQLEQAWVGHVSAEGELLAMDRGFWHGQAAAAASSEDAAYVLLFEFDEGHQQHMYVRKYLP